MRVFFLLNFWNGSSWTIWISAGCKGAILPPVLLVPITQQALRSHTEAASVIIGCWCWGYCLCLSADQTRVSNISAHTQMYMHAHIELRNVKKTRDTPSTHTKPTCTKAIHISTKCEHRKRIKKENMAETVGCAVCSDHSSVGTCYVTHAPLHSASTVPKSASLQCVFITLNG